jgi:hypothetical protein
MFPLELRYGQSIDAVVLGMGADELHEVGYVDGITGSATQLEHRELSSSIS